MASQSEICGEPAATPRPDAGPTAHCDCPAPDGKASRILAEDSDIRLEWVPAPEAERTVGGSTYRVYAGGELVAECYTRPEAEEAYRRALGPEETINPQ